MILNFGEYGFFKKNLLRIEGSIGERKFITRDKNFLNEGFQKCGNISYCYPIKENTGVGAYYVETFCNYKGYKFQIDRILADGKYRIAPLQEAQTHFKDFQRHGYDPMYEVKEDEIEAVWEERKLIIGFEFNVEPVFLLKGNKK